MALQLGAGTGDLSDVLNTRLQPVAARTLIDQGTRCSRRCMHDTLTLNSDVFQSGASFDEEDIVDEDHKKPVRVFIVSRLEAVVSELGPHPLLQVEEEEEEEVYKDSTLFLKVGYIL